MTTWKDIPGYFDFADLYDQEVSRVKGHAIFVEVGIYYGRSVAYLAEQIEEKGKDIEIYGIDFFEQIKEEDTRRWLTEVGVDDLINVIKSDSAEAAKLFQDGSVDFVFIDADHSYECVKRDILAWLPKVKKGGTIAGHDRPRPGVHKAVMDTLREFIPVGPSSWMVKVK